MGSGLVAAEWYVLQGGLWALLGPGEVEVSFGLSWLRQGSKQRCIYSREGRAGWNSSS